MTVNFLKLGQSDLKMITGCDLMPGDLLATYESLTTKPSTLNTIFAQKLLNTSGRVENLSKMIHFEILLEKRANPNFVYVSDANESKMIGAKNQDLSTFPVGTALVAFRPKNERVRNLIIDIAKTISANGKNSWKMKGITDGKNPLWSFCTSRSKSRECHIKKMARLAVDSIDHFKGKNEQPKAMNCVQYVLNVVNSAILRSDERIGAIVVSNESRKMKLDLVEKHLKSGALERLFSQSNLFHDTVTSASFAHHLLKNAVEWEPVGCIGISADSLKHEPKPLITGSQEIDFQTLEEFKIGKGSTIKETFRALNLIKGTHDFLVGFPEEKRLKLKVAYCYLYDLANRLKNPHLLVSFLTERGAKEQLNDLLLSWNQFNREYGGGEIVPSRALFFEEKGECCSVTVKKIFLSPYLEAYLKAAEGVEPFLSRIEEMEVESQAPKKVKSGFFSFSPNPSRLIDLEYLALKNEAISSFEKNHLITENRILKKAIVIKKINKSALAALLLVGGVLIITNCFYAAAAIFAGLIGLVIITKYQTSVYKAWSNRNHNVHQMAYPNYNLPVKVDRFGYRPWIKYSLSEGGPWFEKPLSHMGDNQFEAELKVDSYLEYKLFVAPWNISHLDPESEACWQNSENVLVRKDDLMALSKNNKGQYVAKELNPGFLN